MNWYSGFGILTSVGGGYVTLSQPRKFIIKFFSCMTWESATGNIYDTVVRVGTFDASGLKAVVQTDSFDSLAGVTVSPFVYLRTNETLYPYLSINQCVQLSFQAQSRNGVLPNLQFFFSLGIDSGS
jgi:hypothetical protein